MKTIRAYSILVLVIAAFISLPVVMLYLLLVPVHDFMGIRNTVYSSRFTADRYNQIRVGAPRAAVTNLLGAPIQITALTNHPVWALRDEGVRGHYGTNAELQIQTLDFSRPKNAGDYDMVSVWIGPDDKVIEHMRWVTD